MPEFSLHWKRNLYDQYINYRPTTWNIDSPIIGDNQQLIEQEFSRFIQESRIKKDINEAVEQIDAGEMVSIKAAFKSARSAYNWNLFISKVFYFTTKSTKVTKKR